MYIATRRGAHSHKGNLFGHACIHIATSIFKDVVLMMSEDNLILHTLHL